MKTEEELIWESYNKNNIQSLDELLYQWVSSSLGDIDKRQGLSQKLLNVDIDEKYKYVPSDILYRVVKTKKRTHDNLLSSYSYDIRGVEKMKKWLVDIFDVDVKDLVRWGTTELTLVKMVQ